MGNLAVRRGVNDVGSARAQAQVVHLFAQGVYHRCQVIWRVVDSGHHQIAASHQRCAPHVLLPGAKGNLVHPALGRAARFSETGAHPCKVLQFQCHVFQDMGCPGAFLDPLKKATTNPWAAMVFNQSGQKCYQSLVKAGNGVGGMVFQFADIDPGLNDGSVGPDVGAAQVSYPENVDIFLKKHGCMWIGQSTDLALSALCILSYPASVWRTGGIQGVVSSSYPVFRSQVNPNCYCQ